MLFKKHLVLIINILNNQRGEAGEKWAEELPETVREWDEVKNSDSSEKFWDQITNMRSLIGQSIRIPGENAGEEDLQAFHTKIQNKVPGLVKAPNPEDNDSVSSVLKILGHPEKDSDYTIPDYDDKGVKMDTSPIDMFRPIAHEAGLTQKQWNTIISKMTLGNIEAHLTSENARAEQLNSLKTEWGDTYGNNIKAIGGVLKVTDAPEHLLTSLEKETVDVPTLKWLHGIAEKLGGDESIKLALDKNKQEGRLTPEEARVQIDEMLRNKKHPYWDKRSAAHKDAIKKMLVLQNVANPET